MRPGFRLSLLASRRGWQIDNLVVVFVLFVLGFLVILGSWFSAQLALDIPDVDPNTVCFAVAFSCDLTVVEPSFRRKIDRLRAIVAKVIPRVVAVRVSNNKFTLVMNKPVDLDVELRFQYLWRNQVGLMT